MRLLFILFIFSLTCLGQQKETFKIELKNIKGVLTLDTDKYSKQNDIIFIKNENGSLWHKFSFFYDDSDGKYDFENKEFKPFSFHPDYFKASFLVTNQLNNTYSVIVNQENKLIKTYDNSDNKFKFYSIEDFLLKKVTAISFDYTTNPIFSDFTFNEKVSKPKDITFKPVEISGNKMKISWGNNNTGWIKWKENNCLTIKFYNFS